MGYSLTYTPYNTNLFLNNGGIDPATQAFVTAAGITNLTQIAAVNNLVVGLKTDGLWPKMKAIYPFVTDNRNLLSYTEDFSNAYWGKLNSTITSNSVTAPNGTTTADTFTGSSATSYIYTNTPISSIGNNTFSIYVKAGTLTSFSLDFATSALSYGGVSVINLTTGTAGPITYYGGASGWTVNVQSVGNGWYRCSIGGNIATTQNMYCEIMTGIGNLYLWGAQLDKSATATDYQPIATTSQAFISNQFKFNLVNPVDSDAAFRLVFNGGWTHSSNGATANGTNGYADTRLNPLSVFSTNYSSFGVYWRNTFSATQTNIIGCCTDSVTSRFDLGYDNGVSTPFTTNAANNINTGVDTDNRGLLISTRQGINTNKLFRNAILKVNTASTFTANPNRNFYFAARNNASIDYFANNQNIAFGHIGDSLTDTEAANLYTAVQAFQTALSRQV